MAERFGRYTLLRRLASGGMGELFLAQPADAPKGEQLLAVKTLLPAMADDPDVVIMFLDEARLAAQLHHPNICQISDLGQEDGVLFMALEFIHGEDLDRLQRALVKAGLKLPLPLAARLVADAARGLHFAHQLADANGKPVGFIHRDISPHNILVTFKGEVKIIDFGLAKAAGRATQSQSGSLKGKFAYMSPEMVTSERIDHRHDVFALGIVLWELVTGQRLFKAESEISTLALIARCEVAAPSTVNPSIPPALDEICLRALERDKVRRYQTADEVRAALEFYLASQAAPHATADVEAFLREVYRERLEQEAKSGPIWMTDDTLALRRRTAIPPEQRRPPPPPRRTASTDDVAGLPIRSEQRTEQARVDVNGQIIDTGRFQLDVDEEATHVDRPEHSITRPAAPRPAMQRPAAVGGGREKRLAAMPPPVFAPFDTDSVKGYTEPMKMPKTVMTSTVPVDRLPSVASVAGAAPAPRRPRRAWVGVAVGLGVAVLVAVALLAMR
jgi:serine/threonine protein kinase